MKTSRAPRRSAPILGSVAAIVVTVAFLGVVAAPTVGGDQGCSWFFHRHFGHKGDLPPGQIVTMNGGHWLWMRSPEQERVVVMSLYNRYCIRCHGVDGRGVWDIPGIPDFADVRWQASRTDDEIVRITIEGRGAVMPPFRGALSLEEAWGIAHYLRTFVPGTEVPKPRPSSRPRTGAAGASTTPPNPAPATPIAGRTTSVTAPDPGARSPLTR